jgi:hypothetical protein
VLSLSCLAYCFRLFFRAAHQQRCFLCSGHSIVDDKPVGGETCRKQEKREPRGEAPVGVCRVFVGWSFCPNAKRMASRKAFAS